MDPQTALDLYYIRSFGLFLTSQLDLYIYSHLLFRL